MSCLAYRRARRCVYPDKLAPAQLVDLPTELNHLLLDPFAVVRADHPVETGRDLAVAKSPVAPPNSGKPRLFAENAVLLQGIGIIHLAHAAIGVEDHGADAFERRSAVDELLRFFKPFLAHEPVVPLFGGPVAVDPVGIVGVLVEAAELLGLVGPADLLGRIPADIPIQPRLALIVANPFLKELIP